MDTLLAQHETAVATRTQELAQSKRDFDQLTQKYETVRHFNEQWEHAYNELVQSHEAHAG